MTRKIRLTLQYAGTAYCGWQLQPGSPTVQGAVEEALGKLLPGAPVRIHGAGRTDAGVHARAQVAHFETSSGLSAPRMQTGLNHLLPWDIRVVDAADAPTGFHARSAALSKEYHYRIHRAEVIPPEIYPYALLVALPLDLRSMRKAAALLVGTHDFAGFRSKGSTARTTVRTVFRSEWVEVGAELFYRIEADGFLYKMVRTIVGTLIEIGRERRTVASLEPLLLDPDRSRAGHVASARGLHLWTIRYPGG